MSNSAIPWYLSKEEYHHRVLALKRVAVLVDFDEQKGQYLARVPLLNLTIYGTNPEATLTAAYVKAGEMIEKIDANNNKSATTEEKSA